MKKKLLIPTLLITMICLGCSAIAKLGHGADKPKIENEKTINKWLHKRGFEEYDAVAVAPDHFYDFYPAYYSSIFLFDSSGRFHAVGWHQGRYCVKNVDLQIKNLKPVKDLNRLPDDYIRTQHYTAIKIENWEKYSQDELIKIARKKIKKLPPVGYDTIYMHRDSITNVIRSFTGESVTDKLPKDYDYLLVLPFAKYEGKWSQVRNLRKYMKAAKLNTKATVKILLLNLDKQEWWGKEWNDEIKINN